MILIRGCAKWLLIGFVFFPCVSVASTFFYFEPYLTYFYTKIAAQSVLSGTQVNLISQSNFGFGFHERLNFDSGWALLANEQLSQVQFYNDPALNVSFRQTVYSDYNLAIGNSSESIDRFEYAARVGVKERAFVNADTFSTSGIDKLFVYYGGVSLYTRLYMTRTSRAGLGLAGDYLLGMARANYNINDGFDTQVFLRWEQIIGYSSVRLETGYQTTSQNTNKDTLSQQDVYAQLLFSILFP
jgi:hypothetical protein